MLACLSSVSGQTPAQLNLSHDLVSKGIALQNMTPDTPGLDSRPLFQAGVNYASKNHIATVAADRGSYYFLTQNSEFQYVFLTGVANVTIDLQYSDLYFANGNILGIQLANCTNVTLKNFTADYLHLPFTQVTVTSVSPSARTIGFATLSGYPLPSSFNSYTPPPSYVDDGFFAFDFRGGQQVRGTGHMAVAGPLNDSSVTIADPAPWSQPAQIANIQPGDTLVIGAAFRNRHHLCRPEFRSHHSQRVDLRVGIYWRFDWRLLKQGGPCAGDAPAGNHPADRHQCRRNPSRELGREQHDHEQYHPPRLRRRDRD